MTASQVKKGPSRVSNCCLDHSWARSAAARAATRGPVSSRTTARATTSHLLTVTAQVVGIAGQIRWGAVDTTDEVARELGRRAQLARHVTSRDVLYHRTASQLGLAYT